LGARVEDLFGEARSPVRVTVPSTVRLSSPRVSVAEIAGRWVTFPLSAAEAARCADAVVARRSRDRVELELLEPLDLARQVVFVSGCASALGVIADRLNTSTGPGSFRWIERSSTTALDDLVDERTHVAGMHWIDERTGEANVPEIRRRARTI